MPEHPLRKLRDVPPPAGPPGESPCGYAELDVKTNFSFLRGASHPDELVYRAAELGYRAIAITDFNSLAGVVRAHEAAKESGISLIVGARLQFADAPDVLVWAPNRAAYARLCKLLTLGKRRTQKGECALKLADFLQENEGLFAAVVFEEARFKTRNPNTRNPNQIRVPNDEIRMEEQGGGEASFGHSSFGLDLDFGFRISDFPTPPDGLAALKAALGDRLSLAASCGYGPDDATRLERFADFSRRSGIPLLATNDVYYHDPSRRELQDVLTCVRHGCTIREAGFRLFANGERYLKSPEQMHRLFGRYPQAIARGLEIARRCAFSVDELRYEYPDELTPPGKSAIEYLSDLAWEGAAARYPAGIPEKVKKLLEHELPLIQQLHYEHYFLTVYDLVTFARGRGILCQGRGSAANSAVCYCIGVTSVDPDRIDLLFERFISAARGEPPDIDVDFEHERREEVIQYVYEKYGRDRAAMTAEVITYRGRSAVRDVGKAMGLSLDMVDSLAGKLDWWHTGVVSDDQIRESGLDPADRTIRQVMHLAAQLLGFPRHLSQHVGGLVMTRGPLCEMVPIENATMEDRTVIEWDKNDIDALGILKVDVLALGMLTCISKAFRLVEWERKMLERNRKSETTAERNPKSEIRNPNQARMTNDQMPGSFVSASVLTHSATRSGEEPHSSLGHSELGFDSGFGFRTSDLSATTGSGFLAHAAPSRRLELHTIPPEDPAVYDMICEADTVGVFQIESRAQMSMLPRLRPRCFYDLVIEVAIVRPGPIQGDMVHPYLRRRAGLEPVTFPSKALEEVLHKTLGVPLFQEQAMRVAMVGAGFTAEEADKLRRVMAAWRRTGAIETFHRKIVDGMIANGYTPEFAEQCFNQIKGFGEYGFPESHAASFALLVYVSAWLKRHHPAAFAAALLNSQPMGFYMPAQIVRDAKDHGVQVRAVDVNHSEWDCTLEEGAGGNPKSEIRPKGNPNSEIRNPNQARMTNDQMPGSFVSPSFPAASKPSVEELHSSLDHSELGLDSEFGFRASDFPYSAPALRLGFRQLKGFRSDYAALISIARRKVNAFTTIAQFHRLTGLPVSAMRELAEADAFSSMGLSRREALWQVLKLKDERYPLFDDVDVAEPIVELPKMPLGQEVMTDYATAGLSLKKHPVALVREELTKRKIITAQQLGQMPHNRWVKVAGLVLIRQRPGTASGIVFETLEDETGIVNLIVKPDIYDRYRSAARHARLLQAEGYVQRQGQIIHVMPKQLFDLSELLGGYEIKSRDFH